MISSGAAPSFVQKLSEARQAMFLESGDVTMEQIAELVAGCTKIATTEGATKESFGADGYGEGAPYGLSKACVNAYTTVLATVRTPPFGVVFGQGNILRSQFSKDITRNTFRVYAYFISW